MTLPERRSEVCLDSLRTRLFASAGKSFMDEKLFNTLVSLQTCSRFYAEQLRSICFSA